MVNSSSCTTTVPSRVLGKTSIPSFCYRVHAQKSVSGVKLGFRIWNLEFGLKMWNIGLGVGPDFLRSSFNLRMWNNKLPSVFETSHLRMDPILETSKTHLRAKIEFSTSNFVNHLSPRYSVGYTTTTIYFSSMQKKN